MTEANVQVNSDGGMMGVLMELQKSVTSMDGKLQRLDDRIGLALATIPRIDLIEERVAKIETVAQTLKEENEKRIARIWVAIQTTAAAITVSALLAFWAFDHFRMK